MAQEEKHGGVRGILDKAEDAVGGMAGMVSAGTAGSLSADAFVANAAIGNLYEIEAGRIALQRSASEPVRVFARMMVEDHTTATHQLRSALRMDEVRAPHPSLELPAELDARRAGMVDHLRQATDADFDARYLDQQKMAHSETITLLKGYAQAGDNPQLQSVARSALPMVERHQAAVSRIDQH